MNNDEEINNTYRNFLEDVENNTKEIVNSCHITDDRDVPWEIFGVELFDRNVKHSKIIKKYGIDVYKKANEEVPYQEEIGKRLYSRDYSKARRKLGYLQQEFLRVTELIDLDLLEDLLKEKGIPSYIDYENNIFYYNSRKYFKSNNLRRYQ